MKLRWPDPQFGRLSASSGLAIVTIRIGWFFDHSSIDSMKSSNPGSAHWRSSKTITMVPCSAIRSKKARHAANSSSRSPWGAGSSPSRCASRGSIHRRSSGSETNSATDAESLRRDVAGSSVSAIPARIRTISPRAQNVTPSP